MHQLLLNPRGIHESHLDADQRAAAASLEAQDLIELRQRRIVPSAVARYGSYRRH